jgi:Cu(I)/Ag(I) efflux system protein CusF
MPDMRTTFLPALLLAALTVSFACSDNKATPTNADLAPTPNKDTNSLVLPKDGNYNARGKITKINNDLGSIEFDHEDIPGLMPPMIMEFFVKDKAILEGLAVGDEVNFVIEYKHPAETVVSVTKVK